MATAETLKKTISTLFSVKVLKPITNKVFTSVEKSVEQNQGKNTVFSFEKLSNVGKKVSDTLTTILTSAKSLNSVLKKVTSKATETNSTKEQPTKTLNTNQILGNTQNVFEAKFPKIETGIVSGLQDISKLLKQVSKDIVASSDTQGVNITPLQSNQLSPDLNNVQSILSGILKNTDTLFSIAKTLGKKPTVVAPPSVTDTPELVKDMELWSNRNAQTAKSKEQADTKRFTTTQHTLQMSQDIAENTNHLLQIVLNRIIESSKDAEAIRQNSETEIENQIDTEQNLGEIEQAIESTDSSKKKKDGILGKLFGFLTGDIGKLFSFVKIGLPAIFSGLITGTGGLIASLGSLLSGILPALLITGLAYIIDKYFFGGKIFSAIWEVLKTVGSALKTMFDGIYPYLQKIVGNVINFGKSFFTILQTVAKPLLGVIKWLVGALTPILGGVVKALSFVTTVISDVFSKVSKALPDIINNIKPYYIAIGKILKDVVGGISWVFNTIVKTFKSIWKSTGGILIDTLVGTVSDIAKLFGNWGKSGLVLWEKLKKVPGKFVDTLISALSHVPIIGGYFKSKKEKAQDEKKASEKKIQFMNSRLQLFKSELKAADELEAKGKQGFDTWTGYGDSLTVTRKEQLAKITQAENLIAKEKESIKKAEKTIHLENIKKEKKDITKISPSLKGITTWSGLAKQVIEYTGNPMYTGTYIKKQTKAATPVDAVTIITKNPKVLTEGISKLQKTDAIESSKDKEKPNTVSNFFGNLTTQLTNITKGIKDVKNETKAKKSKSPLTSFISNTTAGLSSLVSTVTKNATNNINNIINNKTPNKIPYSNSISFPKIPKIPDIKNTIANNVSKTLSTSAGYLSRKTITPEIYKKMTTEQLLATDRTPSKKVTNIATKQNLEVPSSAVMLSKLTPVESTKPLISQKAQKNMLMSVTGQNDITAKDKMTQAFSNITKVLQQGKTKTTALNVKKAGNSPPMYVDDTGLIFVNTGGF